MQTSITTSGLPSPNVLSLDPLGGLADLVSQRSSSKILQLKKVKGVEKAHINSGVLRSVLHEVLESQDDASRQIRGQLQMYLAHLIFNKDLHSSPAIVETMLSTEQAAQLMGRSRPFVAMLIDGGKILGAQTTAGGHRRVPESSVKNWIAENKVHSVSAKSADYRQAGVEIGMYSIPEAAFVNIKESKPATKRAKGGLSGFAKRQ
jgi:excisionase family DNA binding protein